MSFTTSLFGGGPDCFGTTGFDFVSFRFVEAFGAGGGGGASAAGMSAVFVASEPPQPARATATPTISAERWLRAITARQGSEPHRRAVAGARSGNPGRARLGGG